MKETNDYLELENQRSSERVFGGRLERLLADRYLLPLHLVLAVRCCNEMVAALRRSLVRIAGPMTKTQKNKNLSQGRKEVVGVQEAYMFVESYH